MLQILRFCVPHVVVPDADYPITVVIHSSLDRWSLVLSPGGLAGEDLGTPVPLTTLALQFYTAACARGMGKQPANDVAKLVDRLAGADFRRVDEGGEGE